MKKTVTTIASLLTAVSFANSIDKIKTECTADMDKYVTTAEKTLKGEKAKYGAEKMELVRKSLIECAKKEFAKDPALKNAQILIDFDLEQYLDGELDFAQLNFKVKDENGGDGKLYVTTDGEIDFEDPIKSNKIRVYGAYGTDKYKELVKGVADMEGATLDLGAPEPAIDDAKIAQALASAEPVVNEEENDLVNLINEIGANLEKESKGQDTKVLDEIEESRRIAAEKRAKIEEERKAAEEHAAEVKAEKARIAAEKAAEQKRVLAEIARNEFVRDSLYNEQVKADAEKAAKAELDAKQAAETKRIADSTATAKAEQDRLIAEENAKAEAAKAALLAQELRDAYVADSLKTEGERVLAEQKRIADSTATAKAEQDRLIAEENAKAEADKNARNLSAENAFKAAKEAREAQEKKEILKAYKEDVNARLAEIASNNEAAIAEMFAEAEAEYVAPETTGDTLTTLNIVADSTHVKDTATVEIAQADTAKVAPAKKTAVAKQGDKKDTSRVAPAEPVADPVCEPEYESMKFGEVWGADAIGLLKGTKPAGKLTRTPEIWRADKETADALNTTVAFLLGAFTAAGIAMAITDKQKAAIKEALKDKSKETLYKGFQESIGKE